MSALVLQRKVGEKIIVMRGDDVLEVEVVRITPNAVRIRIAAGLDWNIVREELLDDYAAMQQATKSERLAKLREEIALYEGRSVPPRIQSGESDVEDLGRRCRDD